MITEGNFKYYFNNEPKTREEIEKLIDYNTVVSIDENLCVRYFSPKKEDYKVASITVNTSPRERTKIKKIQELLKEAEKHQAKNGGILQGVEFPFDNILTTEDKAKKFAILNLGNRKDLDKTKKFYDSYLNELKVIEDWNKEVNSSSEVHHILSDFTVGKKESEGKLDYELDWEFIQQMAERMGQNKGKYEPYNWQKSMDVEKLKQSLFRHVIEVMKSNYSDDGRELGHLESIALNALFINYQLKNNK